MSRHRPRTFLFVLCSSALFAAAAHGALSNAIKTSASPAVYAVQIQGFIDTQAKDLSSTDPFVQQEARRQLVYECENHAGGPASPQFQTEYAKDLNKALGGILKSSKDVRARLNVAVVANEVATRIFRGGGDLKPLSPLAQSLLGDKQTAIVLWGLKAAKWVMADTMQRGGNAAKISKLIVKSLNDHSDTGAVVEEAYNSLTLKSSPGDALDKLKNSPQFAGMITPVISDLLDVIALRTQQLRAGAVPPSPQAEEVVTVFLSVTAYPAISADPVLLKRTLKVMGELTCEVIKALANGNNTPELVDVAREYGSFFDTIGQQMQNQGVQKAGKDIFGISGNTDATTVGNYCTGLSDALKAVGVILT